MTDPLEAELDALFQLAPTEMVEARNALSDRLKKAGDREGAARVKSLKRPTPAAWAINQVWFREAALLERARGAVLALRQLHAQDGVDSQQLSAAVNGQRGAIGAVVDAAVRYCTHAGLPAGAPQERKIFTSLQGWLAGAGDELPGRMTHDLEPSGFEAISAVGVPAPLRSQPPPSAAAPVKPAKPAAAPEIDPRVREEAQLRVAEHKQHAEAAHARVDQTRAKQLAAEAELLRAKLEVEDAERALAALRARFASRASALEAAQAAVREAERMRDSADKELGRARDALAALAGKL